MSIVGYFFLRAIDFSSPEKTKNTLVYLLIVGVISIACISAVFDAVMAPTEKKQGRAR